MNAFLSRRFTLSVSLLMITSIGATAWSQEEIEDRSTSLPEAVEIPLTDAAIEPEIAIDSLDSVNIESLGLLGSKGHGLGEDLWRGSNRAELESLLKLLPISQRSAASHSLMKTLLLSSAPVPPRNSDSPNLLEIRLEKLAGLGEFSSFGDLYSLVPKNSKTPFMQELQGQVWFMQRNLDAACSMAKLEVQETSSMFWQKALCICQAIDGNVEEALFSLNLLQELLGPEDHDFYELTSVLLGQIPSTSLVPEANALNLVLLIENDLAMSEQWIADAGPAIQKSIALTDGIPLMTKLIATEHATQAGALEPLALANIYEKIVFEETELQTASDIVLESGGPWARALLYQASRRKQNPVPRAELLQKLWDSSLESSNVISIAVANVEGWLSLPVNPEMTVAAPTIIRALIGINASNQFRNIQLDDGHVADDADYKQFLDDPSTILDGLSGMLVQALRRNDTPKYSQILRQAYGIEQKNPWLQKHMIVHKLQQWLDLLDQNAAIDTEYDLWLTSLRPIISISNIDPSKPWQTTMAKQWWDSLPAESNPIDRTTQANDLFVVLHALGYEIGAQNLRLLREGPIVEAEQVPNVGVRFGISNAARSKRVGDTLLFTFLTLGQGSITNTGSVAIGSALRNLKHIGLVDEARTLAVEFLLNNSL